MATDPAPETGATEPLINGSNNPPVANGPQDVSSQPAPAVAPTQPDSGSAETTTPGLTADEIALYDRQIRLWGAQAQERIRSAKILLISLRALGTEIAKNLTLAGIHSLTIIDEDPVTEEDLGSGFFFREADVGQPRSQAAIPRIQEMNPLVKVQSGGSLSDLLGKTQDYYAAFSCVIACDHDFLTLSVINTAARIVQCPTYAAGIHGLYGYIFADLVSHEFVVERSAANLPTKTGPESLTRQVLASTMKAGTDGKMMETVKKSELYCPLILANSSPLPLEVVNNRRRLKGVSPLLPCLRALWEFQRSYGRLPSHNQQDLVEFTTMATIKSRELQLPPETLRAEFLRSFIQSIGAEITPTAAFVGGRLSEDLINMLGKREQPIQNFALFDGDALDGRIYSLYSPPPEVAMMNAMNGSGMNMTGFDGVGMGMPMDMNTAAGSMHMDTSMMNGMQGVEMQGQVAQQGGAGPTSAPANGSGEGTGATDDAGS